MSDYRYIDQLRQLKIGAKKAYKEAIDDLIACIYDFDHDKCFGLEMFRSVDPDHLNIQCDGGGGYRIKLVKPSRNTFNEWKTVIADFRAVCRNNNDYPKIKKLLRCLSLVHSHAPVNGYTLAMPEYEEVVWMIFDMCFTCQRKKMNGIL